jgi:arsenate reductase (thioredoxin)
MKNILVLCTGNSCRSQMAEGYLRYFARDKANVYSAGIETHGVNPIAVEVMKEDSVDISHQTSNNVNEYKGIEFDHVITVCDNAKENCPYFPTHAKTFHQNFSDPSKLKGTESETKEEFRKTRDTIKNYCESFVKDNF